MLQFNYFILTISVIIYSLKKTNQLSAAPYIIRYLNVLTTDN